MRNIRLSDSTLRLNVSLSFREKIELSKLLDRLEVASIELPPIANPKIDSLLVKSIAAAVRTSALALPVGQTSEGVVAAWNALRGAKHPVLQVEAPMSPAQMEYFWHKKPAKLLEAIAELIAKCRVFCEDVEFVAGDACRGERSFLLSAIQTAIRAGATAVTLCDSAGLMLPDEIGAFVSGIRADVPELDGIRLAVQCADALDTACACSVAAIRAGAAEIKTVCCPGGAARLERVAALIEARGGEFDVACALKQTEIKRISEQIDRMCRGTKHEGSPFDSGVRDAVQNTSDVLDAHEDRAAILAAVKKLGYDLSEEDGAKVCEAFARIAAKKGSVSARELDTIVASAAMQVPPTYRLKNYVVNCGNIISASAHLVLDKHGEAMEGICVGDGSIDAAFLAIERIIGHHYELDDFQIQSVTEGREAMGETLVRLRSNGKLYSGRGISTDIVGASIDAYLSALNKIAYEEAEA